MSSTMIQLLLLVDIGWTVVGEICHKLRPFQTVTYNYNHWGNTHPDTFIPEIYSCSFGYECCHLDECCKTSCLKWLIAVGVLAPIFVVLFMLCVCCSGVCGRRSSGHVTQPSLPLIVTTTHEQVPPTPVGSPSEQFYPGGIAPSAPACDTICADLPPSYDAAMAGSRSTGEKEASWR